MEKRIIEPYFEHTDERGTLRELIRGKTWESINHHDRKRGYLAGGHYHKQTEEYFYVILGMVEVELSEVGTTSIEKFTVSPGKGFFIPPNHYHTLRFLEDSHLIALLSKAYNDSSPDIFK